ncbi:Protein of unknown function (DUF1092) [Synechococcus sp. PCC 7502]|uniref:Tab2/Atab2 family RNA-binding protein n=1 Tax=Synechococcus sp. PCC 7502 TaxID=1173263 RepID=UPI00029FAA25|nr:Tab2/Atab2 family RNA-binding protein [Synechococcus sp. PCC 7502]AFY75184.1 Protein of unknown function (DUF1092) [Synechococcus sp. PCC 7502]
MTITWELDFYSRPVLDENQKKIWELLICNSPDRSSQPFQWIKECNAQEVNSGWLATELKLAIAHNASLGNRDPQKVRFYRPSMTNIITRGCKQAELIPQPSRRLFTLSSWLQTRMESIYPQREGFIAPDPQPLPLKIGIQVPVAKPAPDALMGESWLVASLKVADFQEATEWSMDFGELFALDHISDPETLISGLIITSSRALALAAWMAGVDPVALKFEVSEGKIQLILEAGEESRWILTTLNTANPKGQKSAERIPKVISQAGSFEQAKKNSNGIHFIAIQTSLEVEHFTGFWLLKE